MNKETAPYDFTYLVGSTLLTCALSVYGTIPQTPTFESFGGKLLEHKAPEFADASSGSSIALSQVVDFSYFDVSSGPSS